MENREVSSMRTVVRRGLGQVSGSPSGVEDQSTAAMSAPTRPPPANTAGPAVPGVESVLMRPPSPHLGSGPPSPPWGGRGRPGPSSSRALVRRARPTCRAGCPSVAYEFAVWAPERTTVGLVLDGGTREMTQGDGGWWHATVPEAGPGTDYAFSLDGGEPLPDPRSRWQPHGVHAASRVVEIPPSPADAAWTGRSLPGSVIYEMHVGTYTPDGTFDAAAQRLDHLVELGVDFVELLTVNAFD